MGTGTAHRGSKGSGQLPGGETAVVVGLLAALMVSSAAAAPSVAPGVGALVEALQPVADETQLGEDAVGEVLLFRVAHISGVPPASTDMPVDPYTPPPAAPEAIPEVVPAETAVGVADVPAGDSEARSAPPGPGVPEPVAQPSVQPVAPALPALVQGEPGSRAVEVGIAALEGLDYPWERLGYTIRFQEGRDGVLGMTYPWERRIEVDVRRSMGVEDVREVVAHELGHAVDAEWMTGQEQHDYRVTRGLAPDVEWYGCNGCSDFATPAGDYAEVFALHLLGGGEFSSRVAGAPSDAEMAELETFFRPR